MTLAAGYKEQYVEAVIDQNKYVIRHQGPVMKLIAKF